MKADPPENGSAAGIPQLMIDGGAALEQPVGDAVPSPGIGDQPVREFKDDWAGEPFRSAPEGGGAEGIQRTATDREAGGEAASYWHGIKPMGQIRDSYIVATDDEGLLLFDQHVVHERILFEQIRDGKMSRVMQVQPLLIPETLDLTPAEVEAFSVVKDELEHLGIETMELSGRTIAIKTAPAGVTSKDVVAIIQQLLSAVERERRTFTIETIRDEISASLACKAAIKVNMPLTDEKMQWLIDELMKTQNPMTCPHGRPIIMRFDLRDIERGFKRPV